MSERFTASTTSIPGALVLERLRLGDERGYFERLFCADELRGFGHPGTTAQLNRSLTRRRGSVRGMHYQRPPHGEWKVITCLRGRVHDVIVDLRRGSPGFLCWHAVELAEDVPRSLLVPPGCAHGFQTLSDDCEMLYLHDVPFMPAADAGVRADDPRLGIAWPLAIAERSPRDVAHPLLTADFMGIVP